VSRTPLGNRSNNGAPPNAASSEEICRDTADGCAPRPPLRPERPRPQTPDGLKSDRRSYLLAEQSRGVFETIAALLKAHGATLADVINIRTYLTDIGKLDEYGTVRREFLTGTPPTSMTFEVPRLFRPEALIEVEVVAAAPATG
jgi:enamine deaminase RidA (YjgF/YER057c/UK114 family)